MTVGPEPKSTPREAATLTLHAVGAFLVACGVAFALTPLSGRVAHRFGILDHPSDDPAQYKKHPFSIPYLGGVAIVLGTVVGAAVLRVLVDFEQVEVLGDFSAGIGLAAGLAIVGLIDDIRPLPRLLRLGAQILAAYIAWDIGFRIHATDWQAFNLGLTLFWIVGITNAFNLLDNMDGLSSGLAGVSALSFGVMGVIGDLPVVAVMAAALCGGAFGFLAHNRHPAKVFMGDAGSLFLGFLIALVGIEVRFENLVEVTFLIPVVTLGLPIFDTTLVVFSRLAHRRPVFLGGRDHVSHRLVKMGLPVGFSVGLLYWVALCLGWLGIVISRSSTQVGWMLLGFVLALAAFFAVFLARVPVYEDEPEIIPHSHPEAEALDQLPPARQSAAR